jgi:hypothetical protein
LLNGEKPADLPVQQSIKVELVIRQPPLLTTVSLIPGASASRRFARHQDHRHVGFDWTPASVEMKWLNGWSAAAAFEGEFSKLRGALPAKGWCATPGNEGPLMAHRVI